MVPWTPQSVSSCGFKVKGKLKKRCKDCYMVSILSVPARQFNSLQTAVSPSIRLLVPWTPQSVSSCGFKVKGKLKKRCKDCYMVVRDERTYIICPTHPRHKQMSFKKKEKKNIIMTPFPVQSKQRMW
ncbi:hypothetical protein B566_EDAN015484 [Ephemera danica]|nr:hypothetical protein B566_EDAN015484 [Ephemera danica]